MFSGCSELFFISGISNLVNENMRNISKLFSGCKSSSSLPDDISKWNTINIENMSFLFCDCLSLESLPVFLNGIQVM